MSPNYLYRSFWHMIVYWIKYWYHRSRGRKYIDFYVENRKYIRRYRERQWLKAKREKDALSRSATEQPKP